MNFPQTCRLLCVVSHLTAWLLAAGEARADGCFLKPVWNKQVDITEPTQKAIIVYDAGRRTWCCRSSTRDR